MNLINSVFLFLLVICQCSAQKNNHLESSALAVLQVDFLKAHDLRLKDGVKVNGKLHSPSRALLFPGGHVFFINKTIVNKKEIPLDYVEKVVKKTLSSNNPLNEKEISKFSFKFYLEIQGENLGGFLFAENLLVYYDEDNFHVIKDAHEFFSRLGLLDHM